MRFLLILILSTGFALAQQPDASVKETPKTEDDIQRERWKMTIEQYLLVHPSRRPGGEMYLYNKQFQRGPHGNLMERVPGGPRRPVAL